MNAPASLPIAAPAETHALIGGKSVAGGGARLPVLYPATGAQVGELAEDDAAQIDRAVAAARKAFADWRRIPVEKRQDILLKLHDIVLAHADELARLECLNTGIVLRELRERHMKRAAYNFRFFAEHISQSKGQLYDQTAGYRSVVVREPAGVAALIAPWNAPTSLASMKVAAAIAFGNTCVLKPSEQTPLTTLRMAELAQSILPPGVLNVITGDGEPVGAGIVRHPDVRMVSLTGDVATGREVAKAASASLKRVHLELGGKAPVIVFDDADPAQVAQAIRVAGYWNSGQDCTAASRVIAGPKIYEKLLEELVPAVQSLNVGDPGKSAKVEMGPVISAAQQERVFGFLERATAKKAEVVVGGGRKGRKGFFVEPTVVTGVRQDAEIVQREVFGPVVTVQRFKDEAQALAWANGVPYGLAASVFTRDVGRALRMSRALEFGTVWINDHIPLVSEMPHGGYKGSGYGKDLSAYSLEDYTQIKHVMARLD